MPDVRQRLGWRMTAEQHAEAVRKALATRRRQGLPTGRPAVIDQPELVERIRSMRAAAFTLQEIADALNAQGVPTVRGGKCWRPSSVQHALGYRRPSRDDVEPREEVAPEPLAVSEAKTPRRLLFEQLAGDRVAA